MPTPRLNLILGSPFLPESRAFFDRTLTTDITRKRHDKIVRYQQWSGLWSRLYFWYGADAGNHSDTAGTLVANGGFSRRILNRRGNFLDANQTTGSMQPEFSATGGALGHPAIVPDGVTHGMEIANDIRLRPPLTICAFGKDMSSGGTNNRYIIGGGSGSVASPTDLLLVSDFATSRIFTFDGTSVVNEFNFPNVVSGSRLITHVYNGASSAAYATGLSDAAGSIGTSNIGIGPALLLFRSLSGNANKGWYNHVMLFRAALSKSQHTALESVLFSL